MNKIWYVSNTGNDQGLICEENTGKNIAVSYEKEDAKLIAASPEAIDLLAKTLDILNNITSRDFSLGKIKPIRDEILRFLDSLNQ